MEVLRAGITALDKLFVDREDDAGCWAEHLCMRHTRNPSRMEDTFDELSAVVEDQVVVATIRGSSVHCATHRCGLIRRNRDVEIRMRRDFTVLGMRLYIVFRTANRSPEYALSNGGLRVFSGVSLRVIRIYTDADMPEPTGTFWPVRKAHIISALGLRRSARTLTLLLGLLLSIAKQFVNRQLLLIPAQQKKSVIVWAVAFVVEVIPTTWTIAYMRVREFPHEHSLTKSLPKRIFV
jgi:hypothetical protein